MVDDIVFITISDESIEEFKRAFKETVDNCTNSFRTPIIGNQMWPYPGGIEAPTKPDAGARHITWDSSGFPKFIHLWNGTQWVDVTDLGVNKKIECDCGSKNPIGQGHSTWCDIYKKEF